MVFAIYIAFSLFVATIIWYINEYNSRRSKTNGLKNLPGPIGLPFVGSLPFIGRKPYETFTKLQKQYGDIYQLKIGQRTVVVIHNLDIIREGYSKVGKNMN
jgi:hypothetical protein